MRPPGRTLVTHDPADIGKTYICTLKRKWEELLLWGGIPLWGNRGEDGVKTSCTVLVGEPKLGFHDT